MNIFSIDLTQNEITFLRQALDLVTIKGTDAKFLANTTSRRRSKTAKFTRYDF